MLGADFHYGLVRPGYALYGGQAFQGERTPVEPVVSAYARVLQVRDAAPPHTVGYSATYQIPEKTRLATIASGYADGFIRAASRGSGCDGEDRGGVILNGEHCPVVGRVSMDLITVDVGHLEEVPERGQWAELIGPGLTLERAGRGAKTIGYEMLTSLSRRFHRVYLERKADSADG
jgi:alanine racemase